MATRLTPGLTPGRLRLLRRLRDADGSLVGADLSPAERTQGSVLQRMGYTSWKAGLQRGGSLSTWTLSITPKGLAAASEDATA